MTDRATLDLAYANGSHIANSAAYPGVWADKAAAFRQGLGDRARLDLAYGAGARQRFDLFLPEQPAKGLLVFVHGGYWMAFGRESWSHLAAGGLAAGWAVAMPSYTLAPAARIGQMTAEIARAVQAAADLVPGPVVVTGHSAGGHLAARMGCADVALPANLKRVVPISPLADLAPIAGSSMNDTLHLDEAEIASESPIRHTLKRGLTCHVWVGAQERPAFLWQARLMSELWDCPWTAAPGQHHFNVIDDLAHPGSALLECCLSGLA